MLVANSGLNDRNRIVFETVSFISSRYECKILVGKLQGTKPLGGPVCRYKRIILKWILNILLGTEYTQRRIGPRIGMLII